VKSSSILGKHRTAAQREHILAAYRQSGLSQRAFAEQAGIGYSTLTMWLGRGRKQIKPEKPRPPAFVAVPNLISERSSTPAFRLQFPSGVIVEVGPGVCREELGALLREVRSL
jgi:hypothetical protein